jgi:DNA-binding CsgD family transcriptional regulator
MISRVDVPWSRINNFLLDCGKIRHPKDFSIHLLKKMYALIPYDEGIVYFLDTTGAMVDEFLLNMDPQIVEDYKKYYSKIEDGRYSISLRARGKKSLDGIREYAHDWDAEKNDELVTDYLRPQGIRHTLGLALYDLDDVVKSVCVMHRTRQVKYSDREIGIVETVLPHLQNLYRNFFFSMAENAANTDEALSDLTARDSEIVALLCKGIGPASIGQDLFISRATVYRHIANIYSKLGVSSLQELLVKAYNCPAALSSRRA